VVELDEGFATGREDGFQTENSGVVLSLLEAVAGELLGGFGFNNGYREIAIIAEGVVCAFAFHTPYFATRGYDATCSEAILLADLVI
jgi:hypothetical protein